MACSVQWLMAGTRRVAVERELQCLVAAPSSGDVTPFAWLPDELVVCILAAVPDLSRGFCPAVCRRWRRIATELIQRGVPDWLSAYAQRRYVYQSIKRVPYTPTQVTLGPTCVLMAECFFPGNHRSLIDAVAVDTEGLVYVATACGLHHKDCTRLGTGDSECVHAVETKNGHCFLDDTQKQYPIRVYDVATGKLVRALKGHVDNIVTIVLSGIGSTPARWTAACACGRVKTGPFWLRSTLHSQPSLRMLAPSCRPDDGDVRWNNTNSSRWVQCGREPSDHARKLPCAG
jgi:hypothetical protein